MGDGQTERAGHFRFVRFASEPFHKDNGFDLYSKCDRISRQSFGQVSQPRCSDKYAHALVAQSVEHILGKNGVTSSSLVEGSV